MHLVIDVLPLWIELLEDLGEHVDCLVATESCALCLELLQQVLGGHGLANQIPTYGFFCQLHITAEREEKRGEERGA